MDKRDASRLSTLIGALMGFFRVTRADATHNHPVDVVAAQMEPCRRRLNEEEMQEILPWLMQVPSSFTLCSYIRSSFDNTTPTRKTCKSRAKHMLLSHTY
ncbi:hypothetical protein AHF37_10097 [Paragonimus kellicotti]|nr:hypothetical protein AHF37_10097 [Paragonimus kellicotti]